MAEANIKIIANNLPTIAIFGRVNVGKSTLFNKLNGHAQAIVSTTPGTTRDSNKSIIEWQGRQFQLIDTGGIMEEKFLLGKHKLKKIKVDTNDINALVQMQVKDVLTKAQIILFVVDAKLGLMQQDQKMALLLKKFINRNQKMILVVNKVDSPKDALKSAEFYKLSLGDPMSISAATGSGTGDLLDMITEATNAKLTESNDHKHDADINVLILGKPNVGKSSLLNAIAGNNKIIVSDIAHTTREPQDIIIKYNDKKIKFIDTAGIVKNKSKATKDSLVKAGITKSLAALKRCDIALLVVDINSDLSHQETKITDAIINNGVNLIIVANKWDKITNKNSKIFTQQIYSTLPFVQWAPIIFLSALRKTKVKQLMQLILDSMQARNSQLSSQELEKFLQGALRHAAPLSRVKARGILKHKLPKPNIKNITQLSTAPPTFKLHAKAKLGIKKNYITYLENRLRRSFKLIGTPIKIITN